MPLTFHPLDERSARAVLAWRYPPPYEVYNEDPARLEADVREVLRPELRYYRLAEHGDPLVAYCCFGRDAQVGGGDYALEALDLGLMVRPDLTGQGRGEQFAAAVLAFARQNWPHERWRVSIAAFNQRAQRVWEELGFRQVQTFARHSDGLAFGVWILEEPRRGAAPRGRWKRRGAARITGPTNRI